MNTEHDKKRIGRGFHRQAGEYDKHAVVQKRVVANLDRLVAAHLERAPERLLDIGCGTGAMLSILRDRYPQVQLNGLDLAFNMVQKAATRLGPDALLVNGDAECLPFQDCSFDLVVSASTFQWLHQLEKCFAECLRVLEPGGLMCVAFFGGKTLWELQESYRHAVSGRCNDTETRSNRLQRFKQSDEVHQMLAVSGFDQVMVASETEVEYHSDVPELLRAIKGIGASTTAGNRGGGLGWRGILNDMMQYYRLRFKQNDSIPATYEVIYVVGRRKSSC